MLYFFVLTPPDTKNFAKMYNYKLSAYYPHVDNFIHILSTEILFALKCDKIYKKKKEKCDKIHKKRRKNVIYCETFENKK